MTFAINAEQQKKIEDWIATHKKVGTGALGGRYTYSFTATSLGTIIEVEDIITDTRLDVTDYEDW